MVSLKEASKLSIPPNQKEMKIGTSSPMYQSAAKKNRIKEMMRKFARKNKVKAETEKDCVQKRRMGPGVRIRHLKLEFAERIKEQNENKAGQRNNLQHLHANQDRCVQLRKEMDLLMQQQVNTEIRLHLMFQILEAKENNNSARAADLTRTLRELVRDSTNKKE